METPHPEKYGIPLLVTAYIPISELNKEPIAEKVKIRPCQRPAKNPYSCSVTPAGAHDVILRKSMRIKTILIILLNFIKGFLS